MDDENKNVLREIFWPAVFIASLSFIIAVFPRFIITFGWASDDFLSIYTGSIGFVDWLVVLVVVASLIFGTLMVKHSENEVAPENIFDKFALFNRHLWSRISGTISASEKDGEGNFSKVDQERNFVDFSVN